MVVSAIFVFHDFSIKNSPQKPYAYLNVKPNPNSGIFVIELTENKTGQNTDKISATDITIYSMTGSKAYSGTGSGNEIKLDLSFLMPGMYYLQVKKGTAIFNQKIIIQ